MERFGFYNENVVEEKIKSISNMAVVKRQFDSGLSDTLRESLVLKTYKGNYLLR